MKNSIGLEIEFNELHRDLNLAINRNRDHWKLINEHCGYELKLKSPLHTWTDLRSFYVSMMDVASHSDGCGFYNAGTHIHFGINAEIPHPKKKVAKKLTASIFSGEYTGVAKYDNPINPYKSVYWVDSNGKFWDSLAQWRQSNANNNESLYANTPSNLLSVVKRLFLIGSIYAMPIIALQHPDRRINKYCHTIADWNMSDIVSATSIATIATSPKMGGNSRRLMLNPLAYPKWGTIEVRLPKATLSSADILAHIYLWNKIVSFAKGDKDIVFLPYNELTKETIKNRFLYLLNLVNIPLNSVKGRYLLAMFDKNIGNAQTNAICYTNCGFTGPIRKFDDFGLSRLVCNNCTAHRNFCASCGNSYPYNRLTDFKSPVAKNYRRYLCDSCSMNSNHISNLEVKNNFIYSLGCVIGEGFNSDGFKALERIINVFDI